METLKDVWCKECDFKNHEKIIKQNIGLATRTCSFSEFNASWSFRCHKKDCRKPKFFDLQKKVPDHYNKEEALQYNSKLSYSKMCNKNVISRVFCT